MTERERVIQIVDALAPELKTLALNIHDNPELGLQEFKACAWQKELLAKYGFQIKDDFCNLETAYKAVYKGKKQGPKIAFLAEYDALPGIGHACGHNLFGATSSLAAVALKSVIDTVGGKVRVYGTPGEEGGENGSAKASFVREGFFKDVDAALCVHASRDGHILTCPSLACAPVDIQFHGKASHAASAPENGINALDAVIAVYNSINALRQHLTSDVRIHGIITHGGDVPNVVPDYAAAKFYLRAATAPGLDAVYQKVENIVRGSALATGAAGSMTPSQNRVDNTVITPSFDAVYQEELSAFGFTAEPASSVKSIGSTDVGNVSQVVPTIQPQIRISDTPIAGHTEAFKKAAGSQKGLDSIALGGEVLARVALRLITETDLLKAIQAEHRVQVARQSNPG